MAAEGVALRKRQQIAKANRMMFLWVAGVSAVVGIAVVASLFLVQKVAFNQKVLNEKAKTISTLERNNAIVDELQNQIRLLNTNDQLKGNMVNGETQPVQVVLDALPAGGNSSAFGASLQQKFLQADGIEIESLIVQPIQEIEVVQAEGESQSADTSLSENPDSQYRIGFSFSVKADSGNAAALKDMLVRLERSIRPIAITNTVIEVQGDKISLKAQGHTYYQPMKTVDLKDKVIKP